jgi:gp16 family phage-associated protein
MSPARSVQEAREWFEVTGLTVTQWAHDHGFPPSVVYALLSGRTRGRRGHAHRAAVALGLKPNVTLLGANETAPTFDAPSGRVEEVVP